MAYFFDSHCRLTTIKPLILAALNFGSSNYEIILAPLILAFYLSELPVIQCTKLPFEYSRPIIFANLVRSQNLRNKGHVKILGFAVNRLTLYSCLFLCITLFLFFVGLRFFFVCLFVSAAVWRNKVLCKYRRQDHGNWCTYS